jgi:hypothetical protein
LKEKSWEIVTQPKGFLGEVFLNDLSSVSPSFWYVPAKNSKQKLAGNAAKHTQNVTKNFCFYTEIFGIKI